MAQDGDSAEQMAEIMNKLIADAAKADAECERLRGEARAHFDAEVELANYMQCKYDNAKMQGARYRLQRDYLLSLLPADADPFGGMDFVMYLANTLNQIEDEGELGSDSDDDPRAEPGGHPTESDSD